MANSLEKPESTRLTDSQRAALTKLAQRRQYRSTLLALSFERQREFIEDPSPLKAALCTRRAGKTYGLALYFDLCSSRFPGCNMLYTGLTRLSAKRILKKDCMDDLEGKLPSRRRWNGSELFYRYPNNSMLYLLGVDASEQERAKALGQKYKLVVVDEPQDYNIDLEEFVYTTIKPALADEQGQLVLSGTPGNNVHSFFHKVTTGQVPGWSLHKWSALDNPHMREQWLSEIAQLHAMYGDELYTMAWFRQQYLGEWVIDLDRLVYRFERSKNAIPALPDSPRDSTERWHYVLGIDLGWEDATAFSLLAYRDYDRKTYVVESWKKSEMYLSDVEAVLKSYRARFSTLSHMIIDNADKQAVEELKRRTQFALIPTEKAGKYDFIQILNSELQLGNIQVVEKGSEPLIDEWQTLIWDEKRLEKGDHLEKQGLPNHCSDAALYAWRYTYSYILKERSLEVNMFRKPTMGEVTKLHFERQRRARL